jgi:hypothetical protein
MKNSDFLIVFFYWLLLTFYQPLHSQTTVGLLSYNDQPAENYLLFSPTGSRSTYLIDQCGYKLHEWQTAYFPGQIAYLLPDGNLLRTGRIGGNFNTGGIGGRVELLSWEGSLLWYHDFSTPQYQQHHVVLPMPNGNILVLLYVLKSPEEALQAGFRPELIPDAGIWSEQIIEIRPKGTNDFDLIWVWNMWDHLIQDFDPSKDNYGIVRDHPELMDVNYRDDGAPNPSDWLHFNSLDYHPVLDQIIFSSRHHSEIYIVDHSTTSAEASGHSGGIYGKGGDLLYRYGNPAAYGFNNPELRWFYGQHDAQWVSKNGLSDDIIVFNNGSRRPGSLFSNIIAWKPSYDDTGGYRLTNGVFGYTEISREFTANPPESFFSPRLSGVQLLENGHLLICEGNGGRFFETDLNNNIVWEYINPVNNFGIIPQGVVPTGNDVFKFISYSPEYEGFSGRSLSASGSPLVPSAASDRCYMISSVDQKNHSLAEKTISHKVLNHFLEITVNVTERYDWILSNVSGIPLKSGKYETGQITVDISVLPSSVYFLTVSCPAIHKFYSTLILKI